MSAPFAYDEAQDRFEAEGWCRVCRDHCGRNHDMEDEMDDEIERLRARTAREMAGARAVGMLSAMLRMGALPECHTEHVREIIDEWDAVERERVAREAV